MKWIIAHRRSIAAAVLCVLDVTMIFASYFLAMYLTHGCDEIPQWHLAFFFETIPFYILFCLVFYWSLRMYNSVWRFISYHEFILYSFAVLICVLVYFGVSSVIRSDIPRRYYLFGGWLQLWCTLFLRFSYRFLCFFATEFHFYFPGKKRRTKNSMLIGAGAAGLLILRDILDHADTDVSIRCIIDDDASKIGCRLCGIPIVGNRNSILANVEKYDIDEILFAIPSASSPCKREILNLCNESKCKIRVLPSVGQLVLGKVTLAQMHDVTIEELLGRDPIIVKNEVIFRQLSGKVIMVTGGGGSIGSELCRQIALQAPKQLIIFDIYENNAYDIQQELKRSFPDLNLLVLIGSVRDTRRVLEVFQKCRPDFVFHAAAHKHVPLMESSPCEAIKNNVLGTYKTAYAAMVSGCKRFVLISTDKAVNPSNIMGATKRLCEMVVQSLNKVSHSGDLLQLPQLSLGVETKNGSIPYPTEFVAVRFGNVLGSNGSVIPLFKKQIEAGGPVTVTHPDIIRYFMTIPEAVSLVLDAAADARGGEIFVLDMGAPVKIDTLARNLIKLSGFVPDVDIKVEYCGLRPGEKLFEEKLMSEEGLTMTQNQLIHVAKPLDWDLAQFFRSLEVLAQKACTGDVEIGKVVEEMVPTFHPKR